MNERGRTRVLPLPVERYALALAAAWTVVAAAEIAWQLSQDRAKTLDVARIQAGDSFDKDLVYRRWAAGYGGVYVPVSEEMPPNPYLSDIEDRDVTTTSGLKLTLVNPAYMTRQVHELGRTEYGHRDHITSLDPIRPENAPDAWETEALKAFEQGVTEAASVEMLAGEEYMRLMRPLFVEEQCLRCHGKQGYSVGEVRGGISVSVPMAPLWALAKNHMMYEVLSHSLVWLLGMGAIAFGTRHLRGRVNERDRAEEALRHSQSDLAKSEEQFRTLVMSSQDGILAYDKDIRLTLWNPAMEGISGGMKEDSLLGKSLLETFPFLDEGGEGDSHKDAVKGKATVRSAMRYTVPETGKEGWFESSHFPIVDPEGQITGGMGIIRDVTERMQALDETRLREQQLIRADKMASLGTLVSGVAHEINNPNYIVNASVSMISGIWKDAVPILDRYFEGDGGLLIGGLRYAEARKEVPEMLQGALEASDQMKVIVQELRDYAEGIELGELEQVDINVVVQRAVTLLSSLLKNTTDQFSVDLGSNIPKLRASFHQLEQVVINLVQNSCQALPDKSLRIGISTAYDARKDAVILKVTDEGIGIPEEALPHVADPFFTTKRDEGSTGLGLSTSNSIVADHGGTMHFESVPGERTTATVILPLAASDWI